MHPAPSTSNGYAKYQVRSTGIGRVLAEESTVFSIDDHEEGDGHAAEQKGAAESTEKSRLVECSLDSDEEDEEAQRCSEKECEPKAEQDTRMRQSKASKGGSDSRQKELSRLTDEFYVDGDNDSGSDELDLLPPLGAAPQAGWKFWKAFSCCKSRVPAKCALM